MSDFNEIGLGVTDYAIHDNNISSTGNSTMPVCNQHELDGSEQTQAIRNTTQIERMPKK